MAGKKLSLPHQKIIELFESFTSHHFPYIIIPAQKEIIINLFKITHLLNLKCQQTDMLRLIDKPRLLVVSEYIRLLSVFVLSLSKDEVEPLIGQWFTPLESPMFHMGGEYLEFTRGLMPRI